MNNDIEIRPLHPDDGPEIYTIISHSQVARTLLRLPSMEYWQTEAYLQTADLHHARLVAVRNGRILGSASLSKSKNPRRYHSANLGLMVHPDFWGQGVGSALMAALINLADNWFNLLRIELEVVTTNAVAVHLYENFGFEIEGTRQMAVFGDGRYQDEYAMARLATNAPFAFPIQPPVMPQAEGIESISVRTMQARDAEELYAIFRHPAVARTTNQLPSQELSYTFERVNEHDPWQHRFVAIAHCQDDSQKVVGNISIHQHHNPRTVHVAGLGMMVHPHYWALGIGSKLMEAVVDLSDNWLNLKRLELDVHPDNPFAIRMYENFGFKREGTKRLYNYGDGRWADAHFMARLNP